MYRRMPKRGFTNIFAKNWAEVNLDMLTKFFGADDVINLESLRAVGLAKNRDAGIRVLGRGELTVALKIEASHVTAGAKTKIEAAGGTITIIG
jgi:large subunit ribosomal protein L15